MANEKIKKVEIPISGMSCASCVKRVENTLSKIEEINGVAVNLLTGKATLEVKSLSKELLNRIVESIKSAGYEVFSQRITFPVLNLSSLPTGQIVENGLRKLVGVISASANVALEQVVVEFIPTLVSTEDLKKEIEKFGVSVLEVEEEEIEFHEEIQKEKELKALKNRLFFCVPLTLFILSDMVFHFYHHLERDLWNIILFFLATPVVIYGGSVFFKPFFRSLKHISFDMNALVSIGSGSAYVFSGIVTFFPAIFPKAGKADVYFETAATIITIILLGRFLESKAKRRAYEAIRRLSSLVSKKAVLIREGQELEVPVKEIREGDIVLVRPGERIPVDGVLIEGIGVVDESSITGESIPKEKREGDMVFGSSFNMSGSFKFKVLAAQKDTLLSRIISLVKEAQSQKFPSQALADRVASVFVPIVLAIGGVSFISWYIFSGSLSFSLMVSISVLVVACPCAMGLATPIAIVVATSRAIENGILIKNGLAFETAKKVNLIIFDKTGTLTTGKPEVKEIIELSGSKKEDIMFFAGSLEKNSEHPIAQAIVRYAKRENVELKDPKNFYSFSGYGVKGEVDSKNVFLGSLSFIRKVCNDGELDYEEIASKFLSKGETVVGVGIDGRIAGLIVLADTLRQEAGEVISDLRKSKIETLLLTGDLRSVAENVAKRLGIEKVIAQVLPDEKSKKVEEMKRSGYFVAMVGDGINDAPSLAKADVGVAMGGGTDIARYTADAILLKDDLRGILKLIKLSSITYNVIRQNLFWAFFYNVLLIPIAARVFYPSFGILLKPVFSSLAMTLSDLFVVTNSLRIRRIKI
jgi:Cu+-exporting ATPase